MNVAGVAGFTFLFVCVWKREVGGGNMFYPERLGLDLLLLLLLGKWKSKIVIRDGKWSEANLDTKRERFGFKMPKFLPLQPPRRKREVTWFCSTWDVCRARCSHLARSGTVSRGGIGSGIVIWASSVLRAGMARAHFVLAPNITFWRRERRCHPRIPPATGASRRLSIPTELPI